MNLYDKVDEENATFRIRPFDLPDGTQLPYIYLRGNGNNARVIITVEDINIGRTPWTPDVYIDIKSGEKDYKLLVDWWFYQAQDDVEYHKTIDTKYAELKDLNQHISKVYTWLIDKGYEAGKKNLDEFLTKRLDQDLKSQ